MGDGAGSACSRDKVYAREGEDWWAVRGVDLAHLCRENCRCPSHLNPQRHSAENWWQCSPSVSSPRLVLRHVGALRLNASNWPAARAFASTHQPVAGQTVPHSVQLAARSVGTLQGGNCGAVLRRWAGPGSTYLELDMAAVPLEPRASSRSRGGSNLWTSLRAVGTAAEEISS